ncbi:HK97 family phage major capsid protein [Candidatus Bealeia paramacronuclearis]|uniref:HK97 family phage major capsid protein n=1 Tax=Candidatus Bealeia paramacronuclearis TaxID=1921001 RepID=A0ABZ2C3Z8_9PROT|nr:HK97 family phage major capsid protein [Candidatus Bealeia paramacronuclearis]
MHDYDIATTLDDLGRTFQEFKSTQQERLENLEKKTGEDPLLVQKLDRMSTAIDQAEVRLKQLEVARLRPQSMMSENPEMRGHKSAFLNYVRQGVDQDLHAYEVKALSSQTGKEGGFLIPSGLSDTLQAVLDSTSVMRQIANVREIANDALELLFDKDMADAGWALETAARDETKTPEFIKIKIPVHEMYARPRATQKLLDDATLNIEEWLSEKIAQKMAAMENTAFISGDGSGKPKGILAYDTALKGDWAWGKFEHVLSGKDGAFGDQGVDTLYDVMQALKPQYIPGACWLMSRSAQASLRKLRDANDNRHVWQPALVEGANPTLLGSPVYVSDDMPALVGGTESISLAFGNFKEAYQIVDRQGIHVLRDPYSSKPYVEFYTTRRVGGEAVNFEALKLIKFKA